MPKVGDKYVVEITKILSNDDDRLYRVNNMKTCVFDSKGLDQLTPYHDNRMDGYNAAMVDATIAMQTLVDIENDVNGREILKTLFGYSSVGVIVKYVQMKHIIEKLELYQKDIKCGVKLKELIDEFGQDRIQEALRANFD